MARVKICGLTNAQDVAAALDLGVSACGFNFAPSSPRALSVAQGAELAQLLPSTVPCVAVVMDASDDLLAQLMAKVHPAFIQAHGDETPERVAEIAKAAPVVKALPLAGEEDVMGAKSYRAAQAFLFDGGRGAGEVFPWHWLEGKSLPACWGLAGGLNPDNVAAAIAATKAEWVDVASGVESAPGKKDQALMAEFVANARASH